MKNLTILILLCALVVVVCSKADAQTAASAAPKVKLPAEELDKLLAPIALYPDVLLSQILPASTFPVEIVQAARWIRSKPDMSKLDEQSWDPSVKALCRYIQVLFRLDNDLDWTNALGAAFLSQQQDVMDAIQRLRRQAQAAGALKTTPEQTIVVEQNAVRIVPAEAEVVYVPQYNPTVVYVNDDSVSVGAAAAASAVSFGVGLALGAWLNTDCDWHGHCVAYCRPGYWGGYAHAGVAHYGSNWVAAAGPRRAGVVGENGGAYVGPRGAAVWGDNGHGAAWRRPTTYGSPSYTGRYAQYNQANLTRNNVNINRGDRNTTISGGNNVAVGGGRTNVGVGGDRTNVGQGRGPGVTNPGLGATPRPTPYSGAFSQGGGQGAGRASDRGYQSRASSPTNYPARGSQTTQRPAARQSYGGSSARPSSGSSYGRSSFSDSRGSSQMRSYSSRGSSSRGSSGGSRGGRGGGGRGRR